MAGMAGPGLAWHGVARQARQVGAQRGEAWKGKAGMATTGRKTKEKDMAIPPNYMKKIKAELAIDKGLEAVNLATPETASVAKLQWEAQRWVAGKLDSDAYGDKPQVAVQVNLGSLHLDALRAFNTDSDPLS
jgi:hypothetical protein